MAKQRKRGEAAEALEKLLAQIKQAINTQLKEHGPTIRAGVNVTLTAKDFAVPGMSNMGIADLREFYRTEVLGYKNIHEAFSSIRKAYKASFKYAITFLIQAAGADLSSDGPSLQKEQLKHVIDDLYIVQVLGRVHNDYGALLVTIHSHYGEHQLRGLATWDRPEQKERHLNTLTDELMEQVLSLTTKRSIRAETFSELMDGFSVESLEARIYFLRTLTESLRTLPAKVYKNDDTREKIVNAAQEIMDQEVEKEIEEFEVVAGDDVARREEFARAEAAEHEKGN